MKVNHIFKVGERVSFINEELYGTIITVLGDEIVVQSEDGFEYKCSPSELIHKKDLNTFLSHDDHEALLSENEASGKRRFQSKKNTKNKSIPPMEVDLHIHQLVGSTKGLSNYDMLNIQLNYAKTRLEFAIHKRIPRVVFIHGIGQGVLKNELHYLLQKYPTELSDASFQKYGLGATEVYIYQNEKK